MFGSEISSETLITFNPITLNPDKTVDEAVRLMYEHGLHHLPVIDGDFQLIGLVTDHDVSRLIDDLRALAHEDESSAAELVTAVPFVTEVLTQKVHFVAPGDPVEVTLRLIVEHGFHCVPVVSDGRLTGMITTTDFLRELACGSSWLAMEDVATSMRLSLPKIDASATLDEALARMRIAAGYLLIVDGAVPLGVLSDRQLRRTRLGEMLHEAPWTNSDDHWHCGARQVRELLPPGEHCIVAGQTVSQAAEIMFRQRVHGLNVVDTDGKTLGVVTETDLLRAMYNDRHRGSRV